MKINIIRTFLSALFAVWGTIIGSFSSVVRTHTLCPNENIADRFFTTVLAENRVASLLKSINGNYFNNYGKHIN